LTHLFSLMPGLMLGEQIGAINGNSDEGAPPYSS